MTVHDVNVDALAARGTDRPAMVTKADVPSLTKFEGLALTLENIPLMGPEYASTLRMGFNRTGFSKKDALLREASRKRLEELKLSLAG